MLLSPSSGIESARRGMYVCGYVAEPMLRTGGADSIAGKRSKELYRTVSG